MKKMMNRWCEYQNRSKLALRLFSMANQTIDPKQRTIIQPVTPGPVVKFINKKSTKISLELVEDAMEIFTKLNVWAAM